MQRKPFKGGFVRITGAPLMSEVFRQRRSLFFLIRCGAAAVPIIAMRQRIRRLHTMVSGLVTIMSPLILRLRGTGRASTSSILISPFVRLARREIFGISNGIADMRAFREIERRIFPNGCADSSREITSKTKPDSRSDQRKTSNQTLRQVDSRTANREDN